jgi:hypothetical protein
VPVKTYKDLDVYRESYAMALEVSKAAKILPAHEQFELVGAMLQGLWKQWRSF